MGLKDIRAAYLAQGMDYENASAKAAQEAILELIATSPFSGRVTIKGGVLMQQLSKDVRRATLDIDFDFMRYSISDLSIKKFLGVLNASTSEYMVTAQGSIMELKHHDYSGKRVHVIVSDRQGTKIATKLDIGVHNALNLKQKSVCFDVTQLIDGITLLANSKEQVVAEKLKSLLRIGAASTRYKDVFDIYYLLIVSGVEKTSLETALAVYIYEDSSMRERNVHDIARRLERVLNDRRFRNQLSKAKNDWLGVPVGKVTSSLLNYFAHFE